MSAARPVTRVFVATTWFAAVLLACPGSWAQAQQAPPSRVDRSGEILVRFRGGSPADMIRGYLDSLGASAVGRVGRSEALVVKAAEGADPAQLIAALRADPRVQWVQPNRLRSLRGEASDPMALDAWQLHNIGQYGGTPGADTRAQDAWDQTEGDPAIVIAVTDTGVDLVHEEFVSPEATALWINEIEAAGLAGVDDDGNGYVDDVHGWDAVESDGDPQDMEGHGTLVAGVMSGLKDNDRGACGLAPGVRVMAVRVLDEYGSGWDSDIAAGIRYAVDMGARVINASWGGPGESPAIEDAIRYAAEHGVLFVCAAGNSGQDNDVDFDTPASYELPNVLAVAATDDHDGLAEFSSYGARTVGLGAPGVDVFGPVPPSIYGGSYGAASGTSFSSPLAAAAAGLVLSVDPTLAPSSVMALLEDTADPAPELAGRTRSGGRLNAARAVQAAADTTPEVLSVGPVPARPGEVLTISGRRLAGSEVYVIFYRETGELYDHRPATVVSGSEVRCPAPAEVFQGSLELEVDGNHTRFRLTILNDSSIGDGLTGIADYYRAVVARLRGLADDYEAASAVWSDKAADYVDQAAAWRELVSAFPAQADRLERIAARYDLLADWCRRVSATVGR